MKCVDKNMRFEGKNKVCDSKLTVASKFVKMMIFIIGSFAGVGFLTGAEIVEFFMKFRQIWWVGIVVFFILFFCLMIKVLKEINNDENCLNLQNLNKYDAKNTFLFKLRSKIILTNVCALLVSGAMISSLKNIISLLFNHNQTLIFCICIFVVFVMLVLGVKCLEKINYLMIVLLLFLVCELVFDLNDFKVGFLFNENVLNDGPTVSQFVGLVGLVVSYVFMNITQVKSVCTVAKIKISKKERVWFSGFVALILVLIILIFILFLYNNESLINESMPVLKYFQNKGDNSLLIFVCGLFLGLITTLLSCLCLLKNSVEKVFKDKVSRSFFVLLSALLIGFLDFSVCVSVIYPVVGVLNLISFVFL